MILKILLKRHIRGGRQFVRLEVNHSCRDDLTPLIIFHLQSIDNPPLHLPLHQSGKRILPPYFHGGPIPAGQRTANPRHLQHPHKLQNPLLQPRFRLPRRVPSSDSRKQLFLRHPLLNPLHFLEQSMNHRPPSPRPFIRQSKRIKPRFLRSRRSRRFSRFSCFIPFTLRKPNWFDCLLLRLR